MRPLIGAVCYALVWLLYAAILEARRWRMRHG